MTQKILKLNVKTEIFIPYTQIENLPEFNGAFNSILGNLISMLLSNKSVG